MHGENPKGFLIHLSHQFNSWLWYLLSPQIRFKRGNRLGSS